MVRQEQWNIITTLFNKKLITTDLITAVPHKDANLAKFYHAQILSYLAQHHCWRMIIDLIDTNIITPDLLAIGDGVYKHKTSLWMMSLGNTKVADKNALWFKLIKEDLLSQEVLYRESTISNNKGATPVWYLAKNKQWEVLNELYHANLFKNNIVNKQCIISGQQTSIKDIIIKSNGTNSALKALKNAFINNKKIIDKSTTSVNGICDQGLFHNPFKVIKQNKPTSNNEDQDINDNNIQPSP